MLANFAAERAVEIHSHDAAPSGESTDEECDSKSPVFDIFYNQEGFQSIFKMTNLTTCEFQCLCDLVADHVMSYWNIGRGNRCTYGGKDVFLMMSATLKHGSN